MDGYYAQEPEAAPPEDQVDAMGRLIDPRKVADLHSTLIPEDPEVFFSLWKPQRLASQADWAFSSSFIFPDIRRVVQLKRLDIFESLLPRCQQASSSAEMSLRIRFVRASAACLNSTE